MNKERLLNVARALRESQSPNDFTMDCYINGCGTPGCAFGHYAARTDLQSLLALVDAYPNDADYARFQIHYAGTDDDIAGFGDDAVCDHFGISFDEAWKLFSSSGCGDARTPIEAAEYIERFVATQAQS